MGQDHQKKLRFFEHIVDSVEAIISSENNPQLFGTQLCGTDFGSDFLQSNGKETWMEPSPRTPCFLFPNGGIFNQFRS